MGQYVRGYGAFVGGHVNQSSARQKCLPSNFVGEACLVVEQDTSHMVPRDADEKSAASRLETGSRHALLHVVPRSLQSNGIFDGAHADHRTCPWISTGQDDDGDVCHDANGCKSTKLTS